MAVDSSSESLSPSPGTRSTPVLVPQAQLLGKPDIPLNRPVTAVGSSETNRLHLISGTVSRHHALLVIANGNTYVSDLASRTGVHVNGRQVPFADLKTGDRLQIGKFLFRYRAPKAAAPNVVVVEPSTPAVQLNNGEPVAITGRTFLIGRREGSNIRLPKDAAVSATHAVIFWMGDAWYVRDLGSRTGTRVNGDKIHQTRLQFGDQIDVGSATISFIPAPAELLTTPAVEESVPALDEWPEEVTSTVPPVPNEETDFGLELSPPPESVSAQAELSDDSLAGSQTLEPIEPLEPLASENEALPIEADLLAPADEARAESSGADELFNPRHGWRASADVIPLDEPQAKNITPIEAEPLASEPAPVEVTGTYSLDALPLEEIEDTTLTTPEPMAELPLAEEPAAPAEDLLTEEPAEPELAETQPIEVPLSLEPEPIEDIAPAPAIPPPPLPEELAVVEPEPVEDIAPAPAIPPPPLPEELAVVEPTLDSIAEENLSDIDVAPPTEHAVDEAFLPTAEPAENDPLIFDDREPALATDQLLEGESFNDEKVDVIEPTEPTAESALAFDEVTEPLASEAGDQLVSDSTFGKDLRAFTETTTGPIIEQPPVETPAADLEEPIELVIPPLGEATDSESKQEFPQTLAELALDTEDATFEPPSASSDIVLPEFPNLENVAAEAEVEPEVSEDFDELDKAEFLAPTDTVEAIPAPPEAVEPVPEIESLPVETTVADELDELNFEAAPGLSATEPADDFSAIINAEIPEPPAEISPATDEDKLAADHSAFLPEAVDAEAEELTFEDAPVEDAERLELDELPEPMPVGQANEEPALLDEPVIAAEELEELPEAADEPPATEDEISAHDLEEIDEANLADAGSSVSDPGEIEPPFAVADTAMDFTANAGEELTSESLLGDVDEPAEAFVASSEAVSDEPPSLISREADGDIENLAIDDLQDNLTAESTGSISWVAPPTEQTATVNVDLSDPVAASESVEAITQLSGLSHALEPVDLELLDESQPVEPVEMELPNEPAPELEVVNDPAAALTEPPTVLQLADDEAIGSESDLLSEDMVDEQPAAEKPSIFGFDFDGGSFLGGAALPLPEVERPHEAPTVEFLGKGSRTSDIDQMTQPARGRTMVIPPRPVLPTRNKGLTSLTADAGQEIPARPAAPATMADEMVIPPLARSKEAAPVSRKKLTTAFDGLAGPVRTGDAFSQMAIGADAFSAAASMEAFSPGVAAPQHEEAQETEPTKRAPTGTLPTGASERPKPVIAVRSRKLPVPVLVGIMIVLLAGLFAAVYTYVPVYTLVTGSLKFDNLANLNEQDRRAFQKAQLVRLHDPIVRTGANSMLIMQNARSGFLSDTASFDDAMKDASVIPVQPDSSRVEWDNDTLKVTYRAPDQTSGQQQVTALLKSLKAQDADLTDNLKHAMRDADLAKANVDRLTKVAGDLAAQRKQQQQLGEDRPQPEMMTKLESAVASTAILREAAKAATNHATDALQQLRAIDPSTATTAQNDPLVLELRQQMDQLKGQIAQVKNRASSDSAEATITEGDKPEAALDENVMRSLTADYDSLSKQLIARLQTLQIQQSHSAQELRDVDRPKAIEDLSVKITALQKEEARAVADADAASAALASANRKRDESNQATTKLNDLNNQKSAIDDELKQASAEQQAKDAIVAHAVSVTNDPAISFVSVADMRPYILGGLSALVITVMGLLIVRSSGDHSAVAAKAALATAGGSESQPVA